MGDTSQPALRQTQGPRPIPQAASLRAKLQGKQSNDGGSGGQLGTAWPECWSQEELALGNFSSVTYSGILGRPLYFSQP